MIPIAPRPQDSQDRIRNFLLNYQNTLCQALAQQDGAAGFVEDAWQRAELGYGKTRIIQDGALFEQGGVNFSEISGHNIPQTLLGQHPELAGQSYWGAGVSLVLHPKNPFCPTVHLNYRYFEAGHIWWFGGGCDLTPYYPYLADCRHWHQTIKATMDQHDPNFYPAYKYWCDEYFFNHHRNETRGIGGSFYDYQNGQAGLLIKADYARKSENGEHPALLCRQTQKTWQQIFDFQQDNANSFLPSYLPIIAKRAKQSWTDEQRQFQLYRRGRYVEFNLLHDRGTLFGIQSNGRTESILMSLPPLVRWQYRYQPKSGSAEAALTERYLKRHIDWTVDQECQLGV